MPVANVDNTAAAGLSVLAACTADGTCNLRRMNEDTSICNSIEGGNRYIDAVNKSEPQINRCFRILHHLRSLAVTQIAPA